MSGPDREAGLLEEFSHLVETDGLIGRGGAFMNRLAALVEEVLDGGGPQVPEDPFRGKDRELALGSDLYYVMFWRMFDRTPAAMMQDFAIKLRRILAKRVFKRCGEDVVIHHNVLFSSGRNIELGDGVFVNRHVMLDDRAPIIVGDYTTLAAGVIVETHGHVFDDFSKPLIYGGRTRSPVTIGSNSLIGYNAVVMAGVAVGDRCIVASNAVVTKDVPDRTVVGGVPARRIKEIVPHPPDADRGELF